MVDAADVIKKEISSKAVPRGSEKTSLVSCFLWKALCVLQWLYWNGCIQRGVLNVLKVRCTVSHHCAAHWSAGQVVVVSVLVEAAEDNISTEYRCRILTHCRLLQGACFPHIWHFSFSSFNSWLKPLNCNVGAKARTWRRSLLQAFSSAADRLACLWQDLCRLRRGTSPFVVRIPLNIFHRNNYHTICSFLPACCSLSACQLLFSPPFSLPLPHTHSLTLRLMRS